MLIRSLMVVLAVLWAAPAWADVAVVQYKTTANTQAFVTDGIEAVTFDAACTSGAGKFVVASITVGGATSRTISSVVDDSGTNTYALLSQGGTDATSQEGSFGNGEVWIYGAPLDATATTVTVTISSAIASTSRVTIYCLSGVHATTPTEDVAVASDSATTSHAVGGVTTAAAGNILIGVMVGSSGDYTDNAGWTTTDDISSGTEAAVASYIAVGAATTSWTVTTGGNESTASALVAIQPAAAAGGSPCTGMLLGVGCDE